MTETKMAMTPNKCTGCATCALTCSIIYSDKFDLTKAHIRIKKNDFKGTFEISFLSSCLSCYKCADQCPTGCLEIVNITNADEKEVQL